MVLPGCGRAIPDDPQATPATPEGRARAAAVAFLRATAARDKAAWLHVTDVPFYNDHLVTVLDDRDALAGHFDAQYAAGEPNLSKPNRRQINTVLAYKDVREGIQKKPVRAGLDEVLKPDGLLLRLGDEPDYVYLLVRLKGDEARVVGVAYE